MKAFKFKLKEIVSGHTFTTTVKATNKMEAIAAIKYLYPEDEYEYEIV